MPIVAATSESALFIFTSSTEPTTCRGRPRARGLLGALSGLGDGVPSRTARSVPAALLWERYCGQRSRGSCACASAAWSQAHQAGQQGAVDDEEHPVGGRALPASGTARAGATLSSGWVEAQGVQKQSQGGRSAWPAPRSDSCPSKLSKRLYSWGSLHAGASSTSPQLGHMLFSARHVQRPAGVSPHRVPPPIPARCRTSP